MKPKTQNNLEVLLVLSPKRDCRESTSLFCLPLATPSQPPGVPHQADELAEQEQEMDWAQEAPHRPSHPPDQDRGPPLTLQKLRKNTYKTQDTTSHNTTQPRQVNSQSITMRLRLQYFPPHVKPNIYNKPQFMLSPSLSPNTSPILSDQDPATADPTEAPLRVHWNQSMDGLESKDRYTADKHQHDR